jgi:phage baseplate assembly protein W
MANLSDKSGQASAVSIITRKKHWADLDLAMLIHPIRKDIIPLRDDVAIKNAIKNLILTNIYERPFQPFIAGNLRALLFEPATSTTARELKDSIRDVVGLYEPRVSLQNIDIKDNSDNNHWDITIFFKIKEIGFNSSVSIALQRLR